MNTVRFIRKQILGLTQGELARALERTQPTVHRWEQAAQFPADQLPAIRHLARRACVDRGLDWNDSWLFEVPAWARDDTPEVA